MFDRIKCMLGCHSRSESPVSYDSSSLLYECDVCGRGIVCTREGRMIRTVSSERIDYEQSCMQDRNEP